MNLGRFARGSYWGRRCGWWTSRRCRWPCKSFIDARTGFHLGIISLICSSRAPFSGALVAARLEETQPVERLEVLPVVLLVVQVAL